MAIGLRRVAQALALALVLCLLALLVWRVVQKNGGGAAGALRRGDHPTAPNFTLSRLDRDGKLELSSLRGKAVVLNFWASWCVPCKKEAPLLEQAAKQWRTEGRGRRRRRRERLLRRRPEVHAPLRDQLSRRPRRRGRRGSTTTG